MDEQRPGKKLSFVDVTTNCSLFACRIAKDRKYRKLEKILEEYAATELRTPVGLKLKENGLQQYAKGLYDGKITTVAEAQGLTDRDLRYMKVDNVADRKKILVLFGALENKKKEKEEVLTAIALEDETRNVVESSVIGTQRQPMQSTLATVTSLPNAPRGQIQQNQNEEQEIPYAKPVLE